MKMKFAIFSDFDGTLTDRDTIDLLVETFIGAEYKRSISRRLLAGQMTIREALSDEFARLSMPPERLSEFLLARVRVDPHLNELLCYARERAWPFTILSSGMDALILPLLEKAGSDAPVRCNRLVWQEAQHPDLEPGLHVEFIDDSDHGHDKASELRAARGAGFRVLYMGDGLSDIPCAAEADVLFARRQLERHCREHGIAYHPLGSCADVLSYLQSAAAK